MMVDIVLRVLKAVTDQTNLSHILVRDLDVGKNRRAIE